MTPKPAPSQDKLAPIAKHTQSIFSKYGISVNSGDIVVADIVHDRLLIIARLSARSGMILKRRLREIGAALDKGRAEIKYNEETHEAVITISKPRGEMPIHMCPSETIDGFTSHIPVAQQLYGVAGGNEMYIPADLYGFFPVAGLRNIAVIGAPKTGKTNFLETIKEYHSKKDGRVYVDQLTQDTFEESLKDVMEIIKEMKSGVDRTRGQLMVLLVDDINFAAIAKNKKRYEMLKDVLKIGPDYDIYFYFTSTKDLPRDLSKYFDTTIEMQIHKHRQPGFALIRNSIFKNPPYGFDTLAVRFFKARDVAEKR